MQQPIPTDTRFTLVVYDTGEAARLAQRFAAAAISAGLAIEQIFFYYSGVHEADANRALAQDDPMPVIPWPDLAASGNFSLNVCIAAGARRGILNSGEARRLDKPAANLDPAFELVGLGVLLEGITNADRLVTFDN